MERLPFHLEDKQKRAKHFLNTRFRGKQLSWARVPMPRCRAAHKTPQRMWLAGHSSWVMTALPKNVGPQERMFWKPFKSLPGKPQLAIHHLQCVWVGYCFSFSSLPSPSSHQIPGVLQRRCRARYNLLAGDVEDKAPAWKSLRTALGSLPLSAFRSPFKSSVRTMGVTLHRWATQREVAVVEAPTRPFQPQLY